MKQSTLIYVMIFLLISALFACILPYPIFSNYNNITEKNAFDINNYKEIELSNSTDQPSSILDLEWFEEIECLLPLDSEFEVIDLNTEQTISVVRTGGKNHADIEPKEEKDYEILQDIYQKNWTWNRRPVLVKINDFSYLPASLAGYPHGYSNTNNTGHFCLHFKNSKMHGTNRIDDQHQKNVNYAKEIGSQFLNIDF